MKTFDFDKLQSMGAIPVPPAGGIPKASSDPLCRQPAVAQAQATFKTIRGEISVDDLRIGDRLLTRDNGFQPILWLGHQRAPQVPGKAAAVRIRADVFRAFGQQEDIDLPAQHRVLIGGISGRPERLIPATDLLHLPGVEALPPQPMMFCQPLFSRHEIIMMNGIWVESLQPMANTLARMPDKDRAALFVACPELTHPAGRSGRYQLARKAS